MHKITIIGNAGSDPEMRYLPSGVAVTNFSLASNRRWKDQDGNQKEETTWFRINAWRGLAEICNNYVTKGKQLYVEGRMEVRQYEDRNGEMRVNIEVTAETLQLLGGGSESQQSGGQQRSQTREPQERQRAQDGDDDEWDVDDLPF